MPTFSRSLEQSLHRALALANERHHEYATLEHLLLALLEDQDAAAVMRACNVDLDKLKRSLQVACTKRPISAETIERTVEQIEAELRGRDTAEVPSSVIGDLAMEKLRQLDQVAYIRFASVYRAFADISSFEDEVRRLIERASQTNATDAGVAAPRATR